MGHITGQSRDQATLFVETLDDLIPSSDPVRVVDAFVGSLDLGVLGFGKVRSASTGRPPYHPGDLLKLYVYGYLNQIRSSRRLERESHRNIEVLWLLNRLCPDFKTIADFRRENRGAIVGVCRTFTQFCRGEGLFGAELVAIDGSKFRAVGSKKSTVTRAQLKREVAQIDAHIESYLTSLDEIDSDEPQEPPGGGNTVAALAALQSRRAELQALAQAMQERGVNQQVTTEPDARLMRHSGGAQAVSYNVQTAVDEKHKLIAAHEVTNEGNDHRQLYPMASAVRSALGVETLTVVADVGYQNGEQGAACEAAGITAVVPSQKPVNPRGDFFDKSQFVYEAAQDQYRCPAGEALRVYKTDQQLKVRFYSTAACEQCHLRVQCTTAKRRSINRHFYADQVEAMNQRAQAQPALMRLRACLSEHPFGTLKRMSDAGQFLTRGLDNTRAEMALSILGYNLTRVINILGVQRLCAQLAR
jgi:transposase